MMGEAIMYSKMLHFFMFTRISNVDAKPDLSLLSVKNHRSRLEPIYLVSLFTFAV